MNFLKFLSLVCATPGSSAPLTYFSGSDVTRRFGFNYFILIECDYVFTDILDAAEWTTAVAANSIHISPPGALVINPPTTTSFVIEGCGREIVGEATYTIDFTTYQDGGFTSAVPDSMVYWRDVLNNAAGYHIMFLDCNNKLFVDDGWADEVGAGAPATIAANTPGYEFSVSQVPYWSEGQESLGLWTTQFTIKKTGILEYYQATDTVVAAIA